jgi:hypothetical protein
VSSVREITPVESAGWNDIQTALTKAHDFPKHGFPTLPSVDQWRLTTSISSFLPMRVVALRRVDSALRSYTKKRDQYESLFKTNEDRYKRLQLGAGSLPWQQRANKFLDIKQNEQKAAKEVVNAFNAVNKAFERWKRDSPTDYEFRAGKREAVGKLEVLLTHFNPGGVRANIEESSKAISDATTKYKEASGIFAFNLGQQLKALFKSIITGRVNLTAPVGFTENLINPQSKPTEPQAQQRREPPPVPPRLRGTLTPDQLSPPLSRDVSSPQQRPSSLRRNPETPPSLSLPGHSAPAIAQPEKAPQPVVRRR